MELGPRGMLQSLTQNVPFGTYHFVFYMNLFSARLGLTGCPNHLAYPLGSAPCDSDSDSSCLVSHRHTQCGPLPATLTLRPTKPLTTLTTAPLFSQYERPRRLSFCDAQKMSTAALTCNEPPRAPAEGVQESSLAQ
eukprot:365247-Chlamydomonas_euryale.AAC.17